MENENNYELLKKLLLELNFNEENIPNLSYKAENKVLPNNYEDALFKEMNIAWINHLGNSVDFHNLQEKYKNDTLLWKKQLNDFENIKKEEDIISFLVKYFERNYLIGYKLGEISKEEIKNLIDYRKPKLAKDFKGSTYGFDNFQIFTNDQLHITLHVKLESFRNESFKLFGIFSFWINEPEDPFSLDMNHINKNYNNLVFARDIMDGLEGFHYNRMNLFDFDKYDIQNNRNTKFFNDWVGIYPHLFITYGKALLNANPESLIDEIVVDLQSIKIHDEIAKDEPLNPMVWFQNLSQEMRLFYNKGKELFLKTSRLLEPRPEESESEIEKGEDNRRKEKLTIEDFVFLYNKALDSDLENGIPPEDAGFRTNRQFFREFLDKDTRDEKNNYIDPVSRGTFYNLIKLYREELDSILEKSTDRGQGGGDAYRIIRVEDNKIVLSAIPVKKILSKEVLQLKEDIHEGMIYYENKAYKEAIEVYKRILNDQKQEIAKTTEDRLGILYYLGKCYLKKEEYENAKRMFEEIYAIDNSKMDAGFRLLICLYHLREYEQAKKLALVLYDSISNSIKPYRSLYRKDILYKEEIRFLSFKREELHPNLLNRDLFTKNLIMFNRSVSSNNFISLRPTFNVSWEIYEKQLQEYEVIKYFLNLNIYSYRKLTLIQLSIQNYIMEIYRKLIFATLLVKNDEKDAYLQVQEVLNYLEEKILNKEVKQSRINDFLLYLIRLHNIYYNKESNEVSVYIHKHFQDIGDKSNGFKYTFPENTNFINWYLYFTTDAMKSGNFEWTRRESEKYVNKSDLIVENVVIELVHIVNLDLNKIISAAKEKLKNLDFPQESSWNNIFNQWCYEIHLGSNRGVDYYKNKVHEYIDYCKNNDLELYIDTIEKLFLRFEKEIAVVKEIYQKGRIKAINEILKQFHPTYNITHDLVSIDYSEKPKDLEYQLLLSQIQNKIFSVRNQEHGELQIKILLFNSEVTSEIYQELSNAIKRPNTIKLELEQNTVLLTYYKEITPSFAPIDFGKYLDNFYFDFFDAIENNTDKIVFKYITEFEDPLMEHFKNQFIKDFNNPYFDFELEHNREGLYYIITVMKKEVK